ncbi:hypothetical protein COCMIDRAFT_111526, partial [Bipolaris oryzae ATCC 44560]
IRFISNKNKKILKALYRLLNSILKDKLFVLRKILYKLLKKRFFSISIYSIALSILFI